MMRKYLKPIRVFHYKFDYGYWYGKYAFFKVHGYLLPIIIPRFHFNELTLCTGEKIQDEFYYSWEYVNNILQKEG